MRRSLVPAMAVAVSLLVAAPAGADLGSDLVDVQDQIDDLESAIAAAEGEHTEFAAEVLETARALEEVAHELLAAEQLLADVEVAIAGTEARLEDLVERMDARQGVILQLRSDAARERQAAVNRAIDVYMAAYADASIRFVGGDDPDSGVGIVYADRVQRAADQVIAEYELHRFQEQQEIARLQDDEDQAKMQRATLTTQQDESAAIAAEVADRAADVEKQLAEQRALLARMDREIAAFEGELVSLAREEDSIRVLIEQQQSSGGAAPGILARPVPGGVESGYGMRIHPIYGTQRLHTGWDMHGDCGTPIVAAAGGRVIFAGWKGGYGLATMIDHGGGMVTLYAHQSVISVSYDQSVGVGDQIGQVGTTGVSTGCHLHFEVRIGGNPVDPSPYL